MSQAAICVLSVLPRDARLTVESLAQAGVDAEPVDDFAGLLARLPGAIGGAMITEDAVPAGGWARLGDALADQPPWSDLPIIVFSRQRRRELDELVESRLANITVLETPVRVSTVVSAARAASHARARQYQVRDLVARLEETDRRKDEFLAMLGHELRNPLGAMQLALQVKALRGAPDRETQVIQRQQRNLSRIVDDLLDVSRVTLGKIQLERAPVDLADSARRSVQALAHEAGTSRLELTVDAPAAPVWVTGDVVRIEQVIANLVTNAIKYTPAGGRIEVTLTATLGQARLTVTDTGIGIEPGTLDGLFDLFAQATQGLDRSRGGLGLGLALVRQLVALHGGTVGAHSDGAGQGASFWFELPMAAAPIRETRPATATIRPLRVLVIEDNDDARELMRDFLVAEGHDVTAARDGVEGLALARSLAPEVMLVDIGLPLLDGHAVASHVRAADTAQPVLIAMTGYGQPSDRQRALHAGFDQFIVKPVALPELRRALGAVRERRAVTD